MAYMSFSAHQRRAALKPTVQSSTTVSFRPSSTDLLGRVRARSYYDAYRAARFSEDKVYKAKNFWRELDDEVTDGQIRELTASTGGVKIIWNKRFTATIGRARCKRGRFGNEVTIELSDKLIDDEDRLFNTLAHEFCHVANRLLGNDPRSHGYGFKSWARECEEAFSDLGIKITRTHSYKSKYPFIWTCCEKTCGKEIGYHSKRIDPKKDRCRRCGGVLVQTNPVPRHLKSRREWTIHE
ncbi:hypothetical protein QM012_008527 [Aureobasidium pullulans]|uniref:SprT-like domain-containing protein n=1 Tax=Aureobasidium pullulans TaxID=5580 RepID=A0ABR0TJN9_AURPU